MAARGRILPFFLPMRGCPARCVFCDQHAISGTVQAPTPRQVQAALAELAPDDHAQLAFYGGSFTCLPQEEQLAYLRAAAPALREGRIGGIRLSTRPDAISDEGCAFLQANGVVCVELGIQSFFDSVLTASGRGYDSRTAVRACHTVQRSGLQLGVQLMTGLPADTDAQARDSLRQALELGARQLRIYPTLVLRRTPLAVLWQQGAYRPQTLEQAVVLCADMYESAQAAGAVLLRMGLNPSPELERDLLDGPYHPAFGALVREEAMFRRVCAVLDEAAGEGTPLLRCAPNDVALIYGQKRRRFDALRRLCPTLSVRPDPNLPIGELRLERG